MFVKGLTAGASVVLQSSAKIAILDVGSGEVKSIALPTSTSKLRAVSAQGDRALFEVPENGTQSFVFAAVDGYRREVFRANSQRADIVHAKRIELMYLLADGTSATACLMLPPGGTTQPQPTVVEVYPDRPYGECMNPNTFSSWNPELLATAGYAVLVPATPRSSIRNEREPTANVTEVVLAVVDAAIERGYVNPHELALLGVS